LYITGDLGDAVVRLTESANLKSLSSYIRSISYFIEKIQCSTDKYDFDEVLAIEELNKERNYHLEDVEDDDEISNINKIFDDLITAARDCEWEYAVHNEDLYDRITDIDPDAFEWIDTVGRVYDRRVILWLVGLQMAWEQIRE